MMRPSAFLALWFVSVAIHGPDLSADDNSLDQATRIGQAIKRSIPLIEKTSAETLRQRKCFTCHGQAMPAFALVEAREHGFQIDSANLDDQVKRTFGHLEQSKKKYENGSGTGGQVDTAGWALWALEVGEHDADEFTDAVIGYLLGKQKQDGVWKCSSKRPPSEASSFATTYLALRGLQWFGDESRFDEIEEAKQRSVRWFEKAEPKDTEDRVFQLLSLPYIDREDLMDALVKQLQFEQLDDGGWSQLPDGESDAYATATVLYALAEAGLGAKDPVYQRGIEYLLDHQNPDGSWQVTTRSKPFQAYFESGFPHGKDQFISTTATCWAMVALLRALPANRASEDVASSDPKRRPNVIVVMTDDQGYGDMSCHGDPHMATLHLDQLHAESIRFSNFHVSPFCTPTRAALMTGRYPARTGAYRTSSGRTSLHPRERTLGHLFSQNGYSTGMFGKWHLGDCAPSRPMDCGFDRSVWHRCGGVTQISDYWTNDYFDDTYLDGDRWKKFDGYCTDVWFNEAMAFIADASRDAGGEKPFFVYLATNAPHGPYLVANKWKQPFLDAGLPKTQAAFKGMVANFDWNLGRLMTFLDEEGLAEDTVLIFLTDNGTAAGTIFGEGGRITGWPKDPRENAGRRGGKSSAYDGGHHVPLFIRWPAGEFGEPRDIDTLAAHLDLTPTLIQMCGLTRPNDWPEFDGRSLMPLIRDANATWPSRVLHSQMHGGNGYTKPGDPWEIGVAMTDRWHLVEGRELYDMDQDPSQRNDVSAEHPDIVARLNREHMDWFESVKSGMQPTRIRIGSEQDNPTHLTSQEWVMPIGGPPWAHGHVEKRMIAEGPWWIDVVTPGKYRISLSRWPDYIHRSIDSVAAGVAIAGQTYEQTISDPSETESVQFELDLPAGPAELSTWLETPDGKRHGAYFATVTLLSGDDDQVPSVLWTQYGLSGTTLKLTAHTNADPRQPSDSTIQLQLLRDGDWKTESEAPIDPLTSMATFRLENWDGTRRVPYRVVVGQSEWEGVFRDEPKDNPQMKLMAVACVNDKFFPYSKAVAQMIAQDPDLVFFAGDQIYESNAGGEVIKPQTASEVPAGMANYLAKWRKFGLTFRDLLKDRPSIMITDDHDVYANDLWGDGGRRMTGDRTTGGYPTHPMWTNAAEATQTAHLPDPVAPGPWGDGVKAYFTSLDYAGVSFAILEDRKFKSPPSQVLTKAVDDPRENKPNTTLEVIKDPAFDVSALDRDDLQLLGGTQEEFVRQWAERVHKEKRLAAVLSQSPFVNIGNYDTTYGDMDSNGWPQSGRNRALRCIAPSKAVMLSGDIHYGTLSQLGIEHWGDGPWSFSVPAFASNQNRRWGPTVPAQGGAVPGIEGSGNHHDRFGNKLTVAATAPGTQGYGIVIFDKPAKQIRLELHTLNSDREPDQKIVPGWPMTIDVRH